jgi:hypothetical protein
MSGAEKMENGIVLSRLRSGGKGTFLRHSFYYYAF